MLDERFINFFEKIKLFKEEQKKQKQRGLNDYNMVNVVRKENAEVGMHSNVIYSLIDPNGLHYPDDLFLNKFIRSTFFIRILSGILNGIFTLFLIADITTSSISPTACFEYFE